MLEHDGTPRTTSVSGRARYRRVDSLLVFDIAIDEHRILLGADRVGSLGDSNAHDACARRCHRYSNSPPPQGNW